VAFLKPTFGSNQKKPIIWGNEGGKEKKMRLAIDEDPFEDLKIQI